MGGWRDDVANVGITLAQGLVLAAWPRTTRTMRTLLVEAPVVTGHMTVVGSEAHHGRSVLRLRVGDVVRLADGAGLAGTGMVTAVERDAIHVNVEAVHAIPPVAAQLLTVALAPPKGDRLSDVVRGLTELGVGVIQLLATERGERLPGRLDRLQRVAAEAVKQCQRAVVPTLAEPGSIAALAAAGGELVVLDRGGGAPACGTPRALTLVIGPEGGLTADELATLRGVGAVAVRLASPILRIETAALAAAAVWACAWEHL